jgi:hypothetical protein
MPMITRFLKFYFIDAETVRRHQKHSDSCLECITESATMVPSKAKNYFIDFSSFCFLGTLVRAGFTLQAVEKSLRACASTRSEQAA